jgi:hypothetical protein
LAFNNILPAPIVLVGDDVFIAQNSGDLVDGLGHDFSRILTAKGLNWTRIAGAKVIEINGLPVRSYIDKIARTVSGGFLDHNIRVNRVVSSYSDPGTGLSQRLGDHASEDFLKQTSLDFLLIPVGSNSGKPEHVNVPFVAAFTGVDFTDGAS